MCKFRYLSSKYCNAIDIQTEVYTIYILYNINMQILKTNDGVNTFSTIRKFMLKAFNGICLVLWTMHIGFKKLTIDTDLRPYKLQH